MCCHSSIAFIESARASPGPSLRRRLGDLRNSRVFYLLISSLRQGFSGTRRGASRLQSRYPPSPAQCPWHLLAIPTGWDSTKVQRVQWAILEVVVYLVQPW